MIMTDLDNLPETMCNAPRWLVWRLVKKPGQPKPDKVPYSATKNTPCDPTDPNNWTDIGAALEAMDAGEFDGIGFALGDGWTGIDLDDVADLKTGELSPWAQNTVKRLPSYWEYSPSGGGLHGLFFFPEPVDLNRGNRKKQIEVYREKRYLTVTGKALNGCNNISNDHRGFSSWYAATFPEKNTPPEAGTQGEEETKTTDEIIQEVCKKEKQKKLWDGDWEELYNSQSEADLALVAAFYHAGATTPQVEKMVQKSGLMRPKWNRDDYRNRTCKRAQEGLSNRSEKPPPQGVDLSRFTDVENSRRFLREHGDGLLYCPERKRWLLWTGARWKFDDREGILKKAKRTVFEWRKAVAQITDPGEFKAAAKAVARCEAYKKLRDMLVLAAPEVTRMLDELDGDPDLFQAGDQTIDLKASTVRGPDRKNLITKTGCDFQEDATAPRFMQFLDEVFEGNQELINYLQRVFGYALLGGNPERIFLLFHGDGANGKSTLVETLLHVFCDYGSATPASTLMVQRGDSIPNDLARLKGVRLVTAQESTEGRKLHAEKIKQMTGNDTISARFMRGEWFDFKPEFLLIFSSNFKPRVDAADDAVWDRLKLIPFNRRFSEAEKETGLQERLKAEGPGILRWLIEGHKLWRTDGLKEPECVKQVRSAFRQEMDRLQEFLAECTEKTPGDMVSKAAFHSAFNAWLKENGSRENFSKKKITSRLLDLGFNDEKTREGRFWCDIKLNSL